MPADTLSLAGKTAVVTGSGRENGIGAGIARALARNGANVTINYVSENSKASAEKVACNIEKDFGVKTVVVQAGVESAQNAKLIVEKTLGAFGVKHIDILVNNAGGGMPIALLDVEQPQLEREFATNVFGLVYMTQAVVGLGKMPHGGRIINIGSIAAKLLGPPAVYSATKAALDAVTTEFAAELGKTHGITVNTIAPGPVPTDLAKKVLENADGSDSDMKHFMLGMTRGGNRLGTVDDIADAVLLVCSEKSRWITAQHISVSGGITGTSA